MDGADNSLLMHICCAPCSGAILQRLSKEGYQLHGSWFNPNIHPIEEWKSRRGAVEEMSSAMSLPMFWSDDFRQKYWQTEWDSGDLSRCGTCYQSRLEETAALAVREGFAQFTTSLLISPWQRHEEIREAGEVAAARHGISFFYRDFRPFYREGQNLARAKSWYMQKYCGCVWSYEESDHPKKPSYSFTECVEK